MTEATEVEVTQSDRDAASDWYGEHTGLGSAELLEVAFARHRQSSVPVQGEPVAWMYSRDGTYSRIHKSQQPSRYHGWTETPLYTHAPTKRERVLLEALKSLHHAVCGETGFAAAVRADSGLAYPWPALDIADERALAAIAQAQEPQ
jgi:hypothetical protein